MQSPTRSDRFPTNTTNPGAASGPPLTQKKMDAVPMPVQMNGGSTPNTARASEGNRPGIQVIDEDQDFNEDLAQYLISEGTAHAGFNYHVVSVFGSQSTGKSTLLNNLFGTRFDIMSETERRQTTKGIWMSKNKTPQKQPSSSSMANNILVMDVEGTDGRERGEDQDFERKAALFALATSEVLIVNLWEHQVGLYHGANMGLLKVVFEVNLELFIKGKAKEDRQRSLLYFVIRDHLGTTPLSNLQNTLTTDLTRIWDGLNKPTGTEHSKINDYFDIAFAALPHKDFQPEKFLQEIAKLGTRFRDAEKGGPTPSSEGSAAGGIFKPRYSRRVPADGFSVYAHGVWEQIVNNKDLDLPTQQELLAQFRCDEIMRDALVAFDATITPFEQQQSSSLKAGTPIVLNGLGAAMRAARRAALEHFTAQASRYQKAVYNRKCSELESKLDLRLKALFLGQLSAAHKKGLEQFREAVGTALKASQTKGVAYDFGSIVARAKQAAIATFEDEAKAVCVERTQWSDFSQELEVFRRDIDDVTSKLRRDEMRRLASRVERWVRTRLGEQVGLEFNQLGSSRGSLVTTERDPHTSEKDLWDRVWDVFIKTISEASSRFAARAESFDASQDELEVGQWRLRRKAWGVLKSRLEEELMEGNLLLKLRENFEDKFRYDEAGVPRIWRPTDDIEGAYTTARESTLTLVPVLGRFELSKSSSPPPLPDWIGTTPPTTSSADEEDMPPIGGIDDSDGKSLEEEMTLITDARRRDLVARFKKTADGVYVEAKRSAVGGITQVPLYFYGLLLALGWNEILAVLRNPLYFMLLILLAIGAYVTYTLNLWGPILKMANAASVQALEEFKKRLREFLESSETGRQAISMSEGENIGLQRLRKSDVPPAGREEGTDDGDEI